jgi:hypothetical protein
VLFVATAQNLKENASWSREEEKPAGADKMTPEKGQPTLAESLLRRRERECAVLSAKLSNLQNF